MSGILSDKGFYAVVPCIFVMILLFVAVLWSVRNCVDQSKEKDKDMPKDLGQYDVDSIPTEFEVVYFSTCSR